MNINLVCHPDTPSKQVGGVTVDLSLSQVSPSFGGDRLYLIFVVDAEPADVRCPPRAKPYRTNELWRTTCFELFVKGRDERYLEFNFAPSSQWAAYSFDGYRNDMAALETDPPSILYWTDDGPPCLSTSIDLPDRWSALIGISAVIEEIDGTKSYWALRHPPGPPDFHHPDCFALTLPAPD